MHTNEVYVAIDHNQRVVLVFGTDNHNTHYLGLEGCQLTALRTPCAEFASTYSRTQYTPKHFAESYIGSEKAHAMIPISGLACQVLRDILAGQAVSLESLQPPQPTSEKHVSNSKKNADGPVAQIHAFLDKRLEAVKAGRTSRKDIIDQLVGKGLNQSTVVTQCGVWARNNNVLFGRPVAKAQKPGKAEKAAA